MGIPLLDLLVLDQVRLLIVKDLMDGWILCHSPLFMNAARWQVVIAHDIDRYKSEALTRTGFREMASGADPRTNRWTSWCEREMHGVR